MQKRTGGAISVRLSFYQETDPRSTVVKNIRFLVARTSKLYSADVPEQDAQEYATFASEYLRKHGYAEVEIEFVDSYPAGNADQQSALREEVWAAYRRQ
jgi:hypothetical protein